MKQRTKNKLALFGSLPFFIFAIAVLKTTIFGKDSLAGYFFLLLAGICVGLYVAMAEKRYCK